MGIPSSPCTGSDTTCPDSPSPPPNGYLSQVCLAPNSCTLPPILTSRHGYTLIIPVGFPNPHNSPELCRATLLPCLVSDTSRRTALRPGHTPRPAQTVMCLPACPPTQLSPPCPAPPSFFCHNWRGPCSTLIDGFRTSTDYASIAPSLTLKVSRMNNPLYGPLTYKSTWEAFLEQFLVFFLICPFRPFLVIENTDSSLNTATICFIYNSEKNQINLNLPQ